ncbi:hypothetical protein WAX78_15710 [Bacillus sp. FJAT-53711]|uniref:Glucose/Sorbosone dehydrogenase domain-containing protein n=1 Tax=Bacillus yunxiaonensis TaxID=3127665 RepID=A0ABU8FY12_9BACI
MVPSGYKIEALAENLTTPFNLTFTDQWEILIADAGIASGNGKALMIIPTGTKVIAEGFKPPLTGITFYKDNIYVAHRGFITIVKPDGSKKDIISGLLSFGDHHNNRVIFGPVGEAFIAEFGSEAPNTTGGKPARKVGHRVSRINPETGVIMTFAINKTGLAAFTTGGGGLERPIVVTSGKQNEMYITDFGIYKSPGIKTQV